MLRAALAQLSPRTKFEIRSSFTRSRDRKCDLQNGVVYGIGSYRSLVLVTAHRLPNTAPL